MFLKICCMMLAGALALSAATNVSLSGTVKDTSGAVITGAIVSLVKQAAIKDTTDATGAFSLIGILTGVSTPYAISAQQQPSISGNGKFVQFTTGANSADANIAIFSGNGRQVVSLSLGKLAAGRHNAALPVLAPGLYVMNITIDQATVSTKLMNTRSGIYVSNEGSSPSIGGASQLTTAAAAVDEITVSKSGFATTKFAVDSYTKTSIAIVMKKDNGTGGTCSTPMPKLPAISAITYSNAKHPDAFTFKYMNLDNPKVTTKAQWECRKAEISLMTQEYMYGHLPPKCEVVGTVSSAGLITAKCTYNGKTVNVTADTKSSTGDILILDFGTANPFPKPANSRTAGVSGATFLSNAKSLFGSSDMGICMASAWGTGRIIDALEQNPTGGISAKKVITTGCSTNGKQALFAGVFEPRVAICAPVESGAAGSCSWRVSKKYGNGNSNTDCQDITHLETNWTGTMTDNTWEKGSPSIDKLPFDQGEVMALRAPGAMMVFNNYKEWKWLCARGNVAAAQSCHWIYKALGASENFGFAESKADHGHCSWPTEHTPQLNAFYDKFLNGKTDANTNIMQWNSASAETDLWFKFGTGKDEWDTNLVLQ